MPATPPGWDDDDRIGVPTAGRAATLPKPPREDLGGLTPPARQDDVELREGETELGRPPQVPAALDLLSDADRATLRKLDEERAAKELAEAELLLAADPTGLGWLGWFGAPLVLAFVAGSVGLAGLFTANQALALVANLNALPDWARYTGYAGLALLCGCVLFAAGRFVLLYARLRRNRQVQVRGLRELAQRTRLRWLAAAKSAEAREQLEAYLRAYPLDGQKERTTLLALGLTDDTQARLRAVRDQLLDPAKFASTEQWFAKFRDEFQAEVDAAAEARVRYWASRIWVVTAVAPNAVVDTGATLFYAVSMLTDLCRLYQVRAGRAGTGVLLGRVFFNAYLAGQGAEWEKVVEDQYDQLFHEALGVVGVGVGSNLAGKVLGKVGARATTGYLNRVMLARLGRYATQLLRPVAR
jgi:putative membrane protein